MALTEGTKKSMKFKLRILFNVLTILISIPIFILNILTILKLQNLNKTHHSTSIEQIGLGGGAGGGIGGSDVTEDYSFDDLMSVSIALVVITVLTSFITIVNLICLTFFPFKKTWSLNLIFSLVFIIFSIALNIGYTILIFTKGPRLFNTDLYLDFPSQDTINYNSTLNQFNDYQTHHSSLNSNSFLYISLWSTKSFLICTWLFSFFSILNIILEMISNDSINEEIGQKVIIIYNHFSNSNPTSNQRRSFPATVPEKVSSNFIDF
ncbi:hypothetical protein DFH28DRAFT_358918 [Melampsora americana]|nr:hypothetical protein DFH28DRAFT_358918 [Melampsora americana]